MAEITSKNNELDRVLVMGASGWFGREALNLAKSRNAQVMAVGSSEREISFEGSKVHIQKYDLETIKKFAPKIVFDTAFITRERIAEIGFQNYVNLNLELIQKSIELATLSTVETYIGFSSGATKHLAGQKNFTLEDNPYAFLKNEFENRIIEIAHSANSKMAICRAWSVSGVFCQKPEIYAFSNMVRQAVQGEIFIKAGHPVYRRYSSVEDALLLSMEFAQKGSPTIFDTGGDLVEIEDLAKRIANVVNPRAKIYRSQNTGDEIDNYHSDGLEWKSMIYRSSITETTLDDQVRDYSLRLVKSHR